MANQRRPPLDGIRVLSQAGVWAGPYATMQLADLGAEVIEVESIQHLSRTRGAFFRHLPDALRDGRNGTCFANRDLSEGFWNRHTWFNYGKRAHKSLTLDLEREAGRRLFLDLVRQSDVFIENNAAHVIEKLDLDWSVLSEVNPRLVMCRFPGFGLSGPYKYYKGFGATMEGLMGHTLLRGYRDSDPSQTPISQHSDPNAGAQAAFGVLAALAARERTGRGQLVEFAQSEALVHHLAYALFDYQMTGHVEEHWGNRHPSMAPYGVFPCAGEDNWITLAIPTDEAFAALCAAMGRPELAADARFADVVSRHQHQDEIEGIVSGWTRGRDKLEAMMELQAAGVLAAAVLQPWEVLDDPHLEAREFFLQMTHPACGTHRYPGTVAKLRRHPLRPEAPAPLLGEHNEEILCGLLAVSEAEYQQLVEDEVIGTAYLETAR